MVRAGLAQCPSTPPAMSPTRCSRIRARRLPGRVGRLPDPGPRHGDALRRRGAAHPARHSDRLRSHGRALRRDEPTIGLHPATTRLIRTLAHLRDIGSTVLIVEHDESMMRAADAPDRRGSGAGANGGWVVSQGTPEEVMADRTRWPANTLLTPGIPMPSLRRPGNGDLSDPGARAQPEERQR